MLKLFFGSLFLLLASFLPAQISLLQQQAEGGDAKAMLELSEKYLFGLGVTQQDDSAQYWIKQALALGDPEALFLVGVREVGNVSNAKAYRTGIQHLEEAAEQGNVDAQLRLGDIYRQRRTGTPSDQYYDLAKAFGYSNQAAKAGNPVAMTHCGEALVSGKGTNKNDSLAIDWFTNAGAEKKHVPAQLRLGDLYLSGVATGQVDPFQAYHWYRRAAGNRRANIDQRSAADLGIHEVDLLLRHFQNALFMTGPLPKATFQYEIRE